MPPEYNVFAVGCAFSYSKWAKIPSRAKRWAYIGCGTCHSVSRDVVRENVFKFNIPVLERK